MRFSEELDIPRNPVVLRALNQARKVVNAIVRRIRLAAWPCISKWRAIVPATWTSATKIKKEQDEYRDRNDKDKALRCKEFGQAPRARIREMALYREQQGKCAYSIEAHRH
jgi:CRISPR-associated endonuclease Csn1